MMIRTTERWEDEFGCIWVRLSGDITKGQVAGFPLEDYARLESHRFPDWSLPGRYARMLLDKLGCFDGGFICKVYPDGASAGLSPERVEAMCQAVAEHSLASARTLCS